MKLSELFTDETKWVKGMNAGIRREYGVAHRVYNHHPRADCFCLRGGLNKITDGDCHAAKGLAMRLRAAIRKLFLGKWTDRTGFTSISGFNDDPDTTFADVQAVIREVENPT